MPRPRPAPSTVLGRAVIQKRGAKPLRTVAAELGTTEAILSRVERGVGLPSVETARFLGQWLGLTIGQVFDAADTPA